MSIPNLFLDMDGVLSDFDGATTAHGEPPKGDFYVRRPPSEWTTEEKAHSDAVQRLMRGHSFWSGMLPYPGAGAFYNGILRLWPGKVVILTALPNNGIGRDIATIKKVWLWKYLGVYPRDVFTCARHEKAGYAVGGGLLVDDLERNCAEFRAAGGEGLQHTDFQTTIAGLRRMLNV